MAQFSKLQVDKSSLLVFGRAVRGLEEIGGDASEVLQAVAERGFYPIVQAIFDSEGRGRWEPLTEASLKKKARRGFGDRPILQEAGTLMGSLTRQGAPFNIHLFEDKNTLHIGSALIYARRQDFTRPILQFEEEDIDRMTDIAVEEINRRINDLGFEAREI